MAVDLEAVRLRDFDRLALWFCSEAEQALLRTLNDGERRRWFYRLWTLKEAFVKAADLDFPADMKAVGLERQGAGWTMRAPGDGLDWQASTFALAQDWIASVVWCGPGAAHARLAWQAAPGCLLPDADLLWRSAAADY